MFNRIYLKFLRWRGSPKSRRLTLPLYNPPEKGEILRALADHAGFQYLTAHLENVKAIYEQTSGMSAIAAVADPKTGGLDGLLRYTCERIRNEEAVFWIGFLQNTVRRAGAMPDLKRFERPDTEA